MVERIPRELPVVGNKISMVLAESKLAFLAVMQSACLVGKNPRLESYSQLNMVLIVALRHKKEWLKSK